MELGLHHYYIVKVLSLRKKIFFGYLVTEKATYLSPTNDEVKDLIFASKICKHTKSNTIVLAKNKQLLASGTSMANWFNLKVALKGLF